MSSTCTHISISFLVIIHDDFATDASTDTRSRRKTVFLPLPPFHPRGAVGLQDRRRPAADTPGHLLSCRSTAPHGAPACRCRPTLPPCCASFPSGDGLPAEVYWRGSPAASPPPSAACRARLRTMPGTSRAGTRIRARPARTGRPPPRSRRRPASRGPGVRVPCRSRGHFRA